MEQTSLHQAFRTLREPRINRRKLHNLQDIIILSILAVWSSAESYDSIELFGKENLAFLKQFLELKNGIPSHDTINRVFQTLNPQQFERCFISWTQGLKDDGVLERVIAIDGKTARVSKENFHHKLPLHSLHAWSVMNSICLGQIACGKKTNEITTIPIILDLLDIKGSIITIDAMGSQREVVKKIVENEADYILAVKGNQGCLEEEVHTTCRQNSPISDTTIVDKGHGRIETRRCQVYEKGLIIDFENRRKGLDTVIKITLTRESPSTSETKERFYISSLKPDKDFNKFILREDEQRKRVLHVDKNFAIVRKIALNLLKKDQRKGSLRTKRLKAAWNKDFLIDLLKY